MVRARPDKNETVPAMHERVMAAFNELEDDFWSFNWERPPVAQEPGTQPAEIISMTRYLPKRVKGEVSYANRKHLEDRGAHDDYFACDFIPKNVDYEAAVSTFFPACISGLSAYVGEIFDQEFAHVDGIEGRRVNSREGVYRIQPVNFFDKELCRRAFDKTPAAIVKLLRGEVESVERFNDGVMIILSSSVMTMEEADTLGGEVKKLLTS